MSYIREILEDIGRKLPDRQRVKATKMTRVKMEPQGTIYVAHAIDTYLDGKVDKSKNNLQGKKLVLFFGQESNFLTRSFLTPKMSVLYQNITSRRDDIEFLFVGLVEGQTKTEYERFAATMPWPCVPYSETTARKTLEEKFHKPLKKKNGLCSIAVLDEDHETVLNVDAEPKLSATHDDSGKQFPWETKATETCCAIGIGAALLGCTIS